MSAKLGVAISFLSSVENGKKSMPHSWIEAIPEIYGFCDEQKSEFDAAFAESEKGVGVDFGALSPEDRMLSVAFARKIKSLGPVDRKILQDVLF